MKTTKGILILIGMALYIQGYCQSELPKYASSATAVMKDVKLDMPLEGRKYKNGTGYSLNTSLLKEMPKKVALVSFYSFDPGMTTVKRWTTSNTLYKTTHTKTTKVNAVGSSGELALGYFLQSIEELIGKFKEYNMELLLPEEYLDTDEKLEFYKNYEVERGKLSEWIDKIGSSGHDAIYGYVDGYNIVDIVNEPYGNYSASGGMFVTRKGEVADNQVWVMDKCGKEVESLGENLCEKLGVDAVVVVYFTIYSPNVKSVILQNVNMLMFGPNPTALAEGKNEKFNFFNGQFYCGTRVNPEVTVWKPDKKDPSTEDLDFTGFENIMVALATKMGDYLKGKD
ncbi:MAG: hypothetical protein V1903_12745 [Bacteroidota bacterium]